MCLASLDFLPTRGDAEPGIGERASHRLSRQDREVNTYSLPFLCGTWGTWGTASHCYPYMEFLCFSQQCMCTCPLCPKCTCSRAEPSVGRAPCAPCALACSETLPAHVPHVPLVPTDSPSSHRREEQDSTRYDASPACCRPFITSRLGGTSPRRGQSRSRVLCVRHLSWLPSRQ